MSDDYGDRLERHEAIITHLITIADEMRQFTRQQTEVNRQQAIFNEQIIGLHSDLDARLGRIEAILERMLPGSTNGREG
jgi:hypothetical protein